MWIIVVALIGLSIVPAGAWGQSPTPASPPRTVTLTLAEYNRLVDLGDRPDTSPPFPPAPWVVATADLLVRVEAGTARGVFTVAGEVLLEGVAQVPLIGSATLIEATQNGRALPLVSEGGIHHALLDGPGPFTVALGWGAPVTQGSGRASFVLPIPTAAVAHATIDLPGDQADVHVTHGLVTSRIVVNGRTVVDVTLDPRSSASVSWSMRDSVQASPARDVRASADVFTLVTVGDTDLRMGALVDVTVLQGELRTLAITLPSGFELAGVSGSSIAASASADNGVVLTLGNPAARSHQFLVTLERPHGGGSFAVETAVVTMPAVQRERGEIAVEGVGTLELTADARDGVHRMDVREVSSSLQALASHPLLSAFRYQRTAALTPAVALDVKRFADAGVLAAVAERAEATTLVTEEGRALTEVKLQVQNRAQPFLKVLLPAGASMISVEVAGESAKPVLGTDGTRVPLLRQGFRPTGLYEVSFVYLHAGAPFARKGDIAMALPRLDMPIGIVHWEVFVPERYAAQAIDGNAIDVRRFAKTIGGSLFASQVPRGVVAEKAIPVGAGISSDKREVRIDMTPGGSPGQILGRAVDSQGASLTGVTVTLEVSGQRRTSTTSSDGSFRFIGVPSGTVLLTASLAGFQSQSTSMAFDGRPRSVSFALNPAMLQETISTMAQAVPLDAAFETTRPSQNVVNLQRRTSGVLPIRVDVPRAGTSHRFVKPLVVDQETTVTLRYRRR
jgi:hypothetical protein